MPIYWVAAEDVNQVLQSGEAQAIISELNVGAALAAAGWVLAGAAAIWQSSSAPGVVAGLQYLWDQVAPGGGPPGV